MVMIGNIVNTILKAIQDFGYQKSNGTWRWDFIVTQDLIEQGWLVLRFWDFEIKKDVKSCADKIECAYINRRSYNLVNRDD